MAFESASAPEINSPWEGTHMNWLQAPLLALGALLLAAAPATATTVLNDTFDGGTLYSFFNFNSSDSPGGGNPDDLSQASGSTSGTGGNPGAGYVVTHTHEVDPFGSAGDGSTSIQSFYEEQLVSYNPSTDGAFDSITFSIDIVNDSFGVQGSNVGSVFFVIHEIGLGGNAGGFTSIPVQAGYQTVSVTLNQSDFVSRDFAGTGDLRFGFGFSGSGDLFDPFTTDTVNVLVDNFVVSVNPVPEPGLALLWGSVALVTLRLRRQS